MGQFKETSRGIPNSDSPSFNSTMGQFKVIAWEYAGLPLKSFNSTMGQFKGSLDCQHVIVFVVSIPLWDNLK